MKIDIKKSKKPIKYLDAIDFLEKRAEKVYKKESKELIWVLEHPPTFTAGSRFKENEILDKKIKIIKTLRGGKITWHGPGQLIFYFVIDLNKRNKDLRKFISLIEETIIETLKKYKIKSFNDRKNIGIWVNYNNKVEKVAAIGVRVKKWIAYHGFSLNINNDLKEYEKIIPCGIKDKKLTSLNIIKKQNYSKIVDYIILKFIENLKR